MSEGLQKRFEELQARYDKLEGMYDKQIDNTVDLFKECRDLQARCEIYENLLKKISEYLNDKIATLPCTSRQRDLPEDEWGHLMYLRDIADEALDSKGTTK